MQHAVFIATIGLSVAVSACGSSTAPANKGATAKAPVPVGAPAAADPEPPCPAYVADEEAQKCAGSKEQARRCLRDLAKQRLANDDDQGALDVYVEASQRFPDSHYGYFMLADLLQNLDQYAEAEEVLNEAKRRLSASELPNVHRLLASIYSTQGHLELAIAELRAAQRLEPDPYLSFQLGMLYAKLDPPARAKAAESTKYYLDQRCQSPKPSQEVTCEHAQSVFQKLGNCTDCFPPDPPMQVPAPSSPSSRCSIAPVTPTGPTLPLVRAPQDAIRIGNAFTVWGAHHHLHSRKYSEEIEDKPITVEGYVVATNYDDVPKCAVHRAGKAEPEDCTAPVPTFYIADKAGEKQAMIRVMGWASNWAQVVEMMNAIDGAPQADSAQVMDEFFGIDLPNPIPAVGARVRVTGRYGFSYAKSVRGSAAEVRYGIITSDAVSSISKAPKPAQLPGHKRSKSAK